MAVPSSSSSPQLDGSHDLELAIERLARRLPEPLRPLATIAYNYRWSWTPGGREIFRELGAHRFSLSGENPVRFLRDLTELNLLAAATDAEYLERIGAVAEIIKQDLERQPANPLGEDPVAFLCAEFGIHRSLPVYSGGLGVLAGDLLKQASDQALPFVGVGLLYRRGYFHQRVDRSGWQQEYWIESDPNALPAVRVSNADGTPLIVTIPVWEDELAAQVWRVQVGRVPLYLLDAELAENSPLQRWVTSRLYEGNREIRLAQYALLGVGAVRALEAMDITPSLFHMNEGHAALATVAVASNIAKGVDGVGRDLKDAIARGRDSFVFTTHTPVPAGNETYSREEVLNVLGQLSDGFGFNREDFLALGRLHPAADEMTGMTPLAIRAARSTNAVSQRHGAVAQSMWQEMFPGNGVNEVPISHVTNAVHLGTWMASPMRRLLTECFGEGWERHASDATMWAQVDQISDEDIWSVRGQQRSELVHTLRRKVVVDRLARGEDIDFVHAGDISFDPGYLTIGFARRLATYKRLHLLVHHAARTLDLLDHDRPVQILFAGKAHPLDDAAKAVAQRMFALKRSDQAQNRIVFVEDYDMGVASTIVAGCDIWLNLPRPPQEASGTSGMKAALNGCLNLSVLDGWWMEAFNGSNGWAIDGSVDPDEGAKDERDAQSLFHLLEDEVKPEYYDRDEAGIPTRWVERIRDSLASIGPMYSAGRMLDDYINNVYRR
jgi:starch phosphorylase